MLVRSNTKTERLFDRVSRYIDWHWHAGSAVWFLDQTAMYCVERAGLEADQRPSIAPLDIAPYFESLAATGVSL
jgi:hypothetical protein